ncbi:hypothetical protein Tco_1372112, partial [Tanacetum coccineum]
MKSQDFNKNLVKRFTRHGTDSMIFSASWVFRVAQLDTFYNALNLNIQECVSQAAAVNYNQGNANYRPQMVANQIRPPDFPPMQNHQNNQNRGINFSQNRGNNFNQNRGNNFNQGQVYQPQINQPPTFQAPPYQALVPPAP